jgi:outer membrane protein insertion porin family
VERLKRLELFESVSITREPTAEENVKDAVVNVKEGVTGNVIFSVGYGEAVGPYFQVRFRERNVFGEARDFRIRALIGTRLTAIYLGYLDRYFLESDVSMDWELYRERYLRDEYGERIYGSSVEFGKPLSEYVRGYLKFRLEHVNFFNEDQDIRTNLDSYPVAAVRFRVFEDRRDDEWWPTRGFARSAALETGYADGPLVKFTTDHSYYFSLYRDLIYGARFYGGLIPYDSGELGITERFFLGGSSDLRGFKYRGVGPRDPGEENMPIGGSTKLVLQNELRFPIYRDLKGVLFGDAGMLDETVHLDTPRASVGTGLRLKISIIRLSLDFAKAIYKKDTDDTRFIHFRLGADF